MAKLLSKVITFSNKKTSMRLASSEWEAVDTICKCENIKRNKLLELINAKKDSKLALTSAVRLFSIIYYHQLFANHQQDSSERANQSPIFDAIKGII